MGTPLPHAVSYDNFVEDLTQITSQFIERDLEIDPQELCVTLSDLYIRFRELFPPTIFGLISHLSSHVDEDFKTKVWNVLNQSHHQINIKFRDRIYKSNRKPKVQTQIFPDEGEFSPPDFHEILASDQYRPYLAKYCRIEFSMENIKFYEEVQQYKSITNALERRQKAISLYNTFLAEESELEINVSRSSVDSVENKLYSTSMKKRTPRKSVFEGLPKNYDTLVTKSTSPILTILPMSISPQEITITVESDDSSSIIMDEISSDLFADIEKEIKHLLNDTYSRFVNSETYKNMLEDCAPKPKPSLGAFFGGLTDLSKLRSFSVYATPSPSAGRFRTSTVIEK
jgi:hypothetical protein